MKKGTQIRYLRILRHNEAYMTFCAKMNWGIPLWHFFKKEQVGKRPERLTKLESFNLKFDQHNTFQ